MHPEYTFTSRYADIDGKRLHYIDEGQGAVIVALHGNPTWSFYYRRMISHLKKHFRVIAPDHIGCGLSEKPQEYDYSLARHRDNLIELLDKLQIRKCSLMVHDWGGAIGMGFAVRFPERIDKLVVLNTAAFRSQQIPWRISLCRWGLLGEILVRGCNGFAWPATFMAVAKSMDTLTKKYYLMPYNSWKNRVAIHRFVRDIPLRQDHPSYVTLVEIEKGLEQLRKSGIPLLLLWGGKDFCFTAQFYEEWTRRFPEAEAHFFADLGHYILEDGFETLRPYIDTFLDPQNMNHANNGQYS